MSSNIKSVFKYRNFRVYLIGTTTSMIGSWMQKIGVGWLAWTLTKSTLWLGLVACADLLPIILLSLVGGVLSDRGNSISIMKTAQTIAFVQAIVMCVMYSLGTLTIEALVLLTLFHGIAMGINQPARLAVVSMLVPKNELSSCIAINSVAFNLSRFIGPACAGMLLTTVGVGSVFALNAATFLVFISALNLLQLSRDDSAKSTPKSSSSLGQIQEALTYVAAHRGLAPLLLLMAISALGLRQYSELLPAISADVFNGGAGTLSLLSSAMGVGAVVSGVWIAHYRPANLCQIVIWATTALSFSVALIFATDILFVGLVGSFATGCFLIVGAVGTQILMQTSVPDHLRGRVLSLYSIIFIGGPALGALVIGATAEVYGLTLPILVGCGATLCFAFSLIRKQNTMTYAFDHVD